MGHKFVWGNTLDFFLNSDVNIINLETSITSTLPHPLALSSKIEVARQVCAVLRVNSYWAAPQQTRRRTPRSSTTKCTPTT
jgi:hypothetical protein